MIDRFLQRVGHGPMLLDAAMGTRLIAAGLDLTMDDPSLWNLSHPATVLAVHRRDVEAGAEALFTNTFGANRAWLARFGRERLVVDSNRQAVLLARVAAGADRFLIGSIGPTAAGHSSAILEQAEVLIEGGVDALVLETYQLPQARDALRLLRDLGKPILVGLLSWPDSIEDTSSRLKDLGASLLGANCFDDFEMAGRLLGHEAGGDRDPLWFKPSTGWPSAGLATLADFTGLAFRVSLIGTGLLGGCCGTTEVHLRAIRAEWSG